MNDNFKLSLVGKLNVGLSIKNINNDIKALEKHPSLQKLKIEVEIDKNILNTLSNFTKSFNENKKGTDKLNASLIEERKIIKDLNGNIQETITQHLKNGEIIHKEIQRINEKNNAVKQEIKNNELLIDSYDRLGKKQKQIERETPSGITTTDKYKNKNTDTIIKANNDGKITSITTTQNLDQLEKVKNKQTDLIKQLQILNIEGKITTTTFEKMSNAINVSDDIAQLNKLNNTISVLNKNANRKANVGELIGNSGDLRNLNNLNKERLVEILKINNAIGHQEVLATKINKATGAWTATVKLNKTEQKTLSGYINQSNGNIYKQSEAISDLSARHMGFSEAIGIALKRTVQWSLAMTAFYGSIRGIQAMTNEILMVDKAMTSLKRVMDATPETYNYMLEQSIQLSKELGNNVHDVLQSLNEVARSFGDNMTEDEMLAVTRTSVLASNVSELTAEEAMENLIGTMNAFKLEASDTIQIVDKMNEVDNNFAVSTKQISEAMSRSAGVAAVYGVSIEELIGNITSISAVTMEAGSVTGRALKTIYSRITTLDDAKDALSAIGVSIYDLNGQVRPVSDILGELANRWSTLSSEQQQNTAISVSGRDQLTRFLALMENWEMGISATNTALNSQNSAMEENAKYQQSLEARINKLKNSFTEMSLAFGDAVITDSLILLVGGLTKIAEVTGSVVGAVGVLPIVFGAVSVASLMLNKNFIANVTQMGIMTASTNALRGALTGLSVTFKGLLASTGVGLLFVGLGVGVEFLIKKLSDSTQASEEFQIQQKQLMDTFKENKKSVSELSEEYAKLEEKLSSGNYNTKELERYKEVTRELATLMPNLITGETQYGEKLIGSSERIKAKVEQLERQLEVQEKINAIEKQEETEDNYDIAKDNLKKAKEELNALNNGAVSTVGIETFYKEVEKLQERMANGDKLNALEKSNLESYQNTIKNYEKLTTEVENANLVYQQSLMEMINSNNLLDSSMSQTSKSIIDDFTTFVSVAEGLTDGQLTSIFDGLLDSLQNDVKFKSTLEGYSKAIEDYKNKVLSGEFDKSQLKKFENEVIKSFENVKKELLSLDGMENLSENALNQVIIGLTSTSKSALLASLDVSKLAEETGKTTDEIRELLGITGEVSDVLDEFGNSANGAGEKVESLSSKLTEYKSIVEQVAGVSSTGVQATEELVFAYETLSNMTELTATQQLLLDNAILELTNAYPHLVKNGKPRIEQIKEENKVNELLLKTVELSKDGQLDAEQAKSLSAAQGAKTRLEIARQEIAAHQAQIDIYKQSILDANKYLEGTARDEAVRIYADEIYKLTVQSQTSKETITNAINEINSSIGGIPASFDKANKSAKSANKTTKESNKTTKESIYVTDEYRKSLEKLNLEIKKQQAIRENEVEYSEKYRNSLQAQIALEKQKLQLHQQQAKALESQIKSGKIAQTGNVSDPKYSTTTTTKQGTLSGWNGRQTSSYGNRRDPITGKTSYHRGIDIASPLGTRLDANVSGKVIASGNAAKQGYSSTYGNLVVIQDDKGIKHLYAHLSEAIVKVGEQVSAGTQIGKIGSTGRSTGPHLHYEVSMNGKLLDPSKYVQDARKGIYAVTTTTKQAVDNSQQAIDGAMSTLYSLQADILDASNAIAKLEQEILNSQLEAYNVYRNKTQLQLDLENARLNELAQGTESYNKSLKITMALMRDKQRTNLEELKFLTNSIHYGNYQGRTLEELRNRIAELNIEIKDLQYTLRQTEYEIIINIKTMYDNQVGDAQYAMDRIEAIKSIYEEGSGVWVELTEQEVALQKDITRTLKEQIEVIKEEIKLRSINGEAIADLKEQIEDLTLSYWNSLAREKQILKEIEQAEKDASEKIANQLIEAYKNYVNERKEEHLKALDEEAKAEDERHKKIVDNYKDEMDLFRKHVNEKLKLLDKQEAERTYSMQMDELEDERKRVTGLINLLQLDDSNEAKSKLKKLQEELDKIDKDIKNAQHNRNITLQKEALNEMVETKQEEIDASIELENDRHEKEIENINKLKEYWNQYYTDLANDERKFAKIREDVMNKNFDAIANEFGEYIQEMKDTMPDLENTLDGTMQAVGTSIRMNIIESLEEAITKMYELQTLQSMTGGYDNDIGISPSNPFPTTPKQSISEADMKVIMGKYFTTELMYQETNPNRRKIIEQAGWNIANEGRSEGSEISKYASLESIIKGLNSTDLQKLASFMEGKKSMFLSDYLRDYVQDYVNRLLLSSASLDSGGMIPSKSGGVDGKGGRSVIVHPNEVILNPIDTKELLKSVNIATRLADIVSPILKNGIKFNPISRGSGDIHINFGDVHNATQQEASKFASDIVSKIKRKGGHI